MPAQGSPATTSAAPTLLIVAHGTASADGSATTRALVDAIAAQRPHVPVELCFLDVVRPTLTDALAAVRRPAVVVPLLLSTGYHVSIDIPAAVAGQSGVTVARHLGPHPLLAAAMADRLAEVAPAAAAAVAAAEGTTIMVAAGSTQSAAAAEITEAGALLAAALGRPVSVCTMADDLTQSLRSARRPLRIVPYLLAEGTFTDRIAQAAAPGTAIAAPLGTHPAVVSLVWRRYDESV